MTLDNTIVADSHGSPGGDIAGKVSGSNNLIDDAAASGGLTNGVNGNLVGFDPKLGALGNNGGSTQTMALLAGSPAIDKGAGARRSLFVTTDQRGVPRINGSTRTSVPLRAVRRPSSLRRSSMKTMGQSARSTGTVRRSARRSASPAPTQAAATRSSSLHC